MAETKKVKDDFLHLWKSLEKTNPEYTKPFDTGSFSGTVVNPVYRYRKMTEVFGPAGVGWGTEDLETKIIHLAATDETMAVARVCVWYKLDGEKHVTPPGFGMDYVVRYTSKGYHRSDDEAAKKAFTDALTNAMKYIGLAADVYMGLYDDSKYVESIRGEFTEDHSEPRSRMEAPLRAL